MVQNFHPQIIPSILNTHSYLKFQEHTTVISGLYAAQAINNEVAGILARDFGKTPYSFIRCETKISAVTPDGSWYNLQAANDIHFRSKRVIQSTGPWINQILGGVESTFTTRIKKIVAFHIQQPPEANDPVFYFFDDDAFLMPKYETGYWLFSFRCDHWDVVPEINTLSIDVNDIQKAQGILRKYAPEFASLCVGGRVFCDAYTNDGDPIIEEVENCPNYVIAGAGAGSGYRLATAIASEALDIFSKTDAAEF